MWRRSNDDWAEISLLSSFASDLRKLALNVEANRTSMADPRLYVQLYRAIVTCQTSPAMYILSVKAMLLSLGDQAFYVLHS